MQYSLETKVYKSMNFYNVNVKIMNLQNAQSFVNLKSHIKHIYNIVKRCIGAPTIQLRER